MGNSKSRIFRQIAIFVLISLSNFDETFFNILKLEIFLVKLQFLWFQIGWKRRWSIQMVDDQLVSRLCQHPKQNVVRINQSHIEKGIWQWPNQRRSVWKHQGRHQLQRLSKTSQFDELFSNYNFTWKIRQIASFIS